MSFSSTIGITSRLPTAVGVSPEKQDEGCGGGTTAMMGFGGPPEQAGAADRREIALKNAEIALRYAAEFGCNVPRSAVAIGRFRRAFEADPASITPELETDFLRASSELAAAIKPMKIAALNEYYEYESDRQRRPVRRTILFYTIGIWLSLGITLLFHFYYVVIDGHIVSAYEAARNFDVARSVMQTLNLPADTSGGLAGPTAVEVGSTGESLRVQRHLMCSAARAWQMQIDKLSLWGGSPEPAESYVRGRYGCDPVHFVPINTDTQSLQLFAIADFKVAAAELNDDALNRKVNGLSSPTGYRLNELARKIEGVANVELELVRKVRDIAADLMQIRASAGPGLDIGGATKHLDAGAETLTLAQTDFTPSATNLDFGKHAGLGSVVDWRLLRDAEQWRGFLLKFMLPFLYGLLGALAGIVCSMKGEVTGIRFVPTSRVSYTLRLPLGALAGATAGLLLDPSELASLAGVTSLGVAFGLGYAVDVFFLAIDAVIERTSQTLGLKRPGPQPTSSATDAGPGQAPA